MVILNEMIPRWHGPVVRALALPSVAPSSNTVLTSGLDLFPVVLDSPDSTPPHFVNSQLVVSCQLRFLIMFLLSLSLFLLDY